MQEDRVWAAKKNGKPPPPSLDCERCFPGVLPSNLDAWEVFRIASQNPLGISASEITAVARVVGVEDELECLQKVLEIARNLDHGEKASVPAGRR